MPAVEELDFVVKMRLGDKLFEVASALGNGEISDPVIDVDGVHVLVAALDAALGTAGLEVAHADAHRHTGPAALAQGLVDEMMRTAETGVGQGVVLGDRIRSAELGDELGLQPVRQIWTAHRRCGAEEPQGLDVLTDEHCVLTVYRACR